MSNSVDDNDAKIKLGLGREMLMIKHDAYESESYVKYLKAPRNIIPKLKFYVRGETMFYL